MLISLNDWMVALDKEAMIKKYFLGKCDRYNVIADICICNLGVWVLLKTRPKGLKRSFKTLNDMDGQKLVQRILYQYFNYNRPVYICKGFGFFISVKNGRDNKIDLLVRLQKIHEKENA